MGTPRLEHQPSSVGKLISSDCGTAPSTVSRSPAAQGARPQNAVGRTRGDRPDGRRTGAEKPTGTRCSGPVGRRSSIRHCASPSSPHLSSQLSISDFPRPEQRQEVRPPARTETRSVIVLGRSAAIDLGLTHQEMRTRLQAPDPVVEVGSIFPRMQLPNPRLAVTLSSGMVPKAD